MSALSGSVLFDTLLVYLREAFSYKKKLKIKSDKKILKNFPACYMLMEKENVIYFH